MEECRDLLKRAAAPATAAEVVSRLEQLAYEFPDRVEPGLGSVIARQSMGVVGGIVEVLESLQRRFPGDPAVIQHLMRAYARARRAADGQQLLEQIFPGFPHDFSARLSKAELLTELRLFDSAVEVYESILRDFPENPRGRLVYAKRLRDRGQLKRVLEVIEPGLDLNASSAVKALHQEARRAVDVFESLAPEADWRNLSADALALKLAIERFSNRKPRPFLVDRLGAIALITGSLGPGGAERQMANTAAQLERIRREKIKFAGRSVEGPIHVAVKTLRREGGNNFFLPIIQKAGVHIHEIDSFPIAAYQNLGVEDPELLTLLPLLPANVAYGVRRLVQFFRNNKIETAFLWQDGAVLFAALAALIAGVPRIVLNIRGLPPVLRPHRDRVEYADMYRALAKAPGVSFVANNFASARAYCEWLDLPVERFAVVQNGVDPLPVQPTRNDEIRWSRFDGRTSDATSTIGGVFRMDLDKRPELWIEFAKEHLLRNPGARFVHVGGGPLLPKVRQLAADLGIAHRILFVGRSDTVGYWLSKLDAFVLLSKFEGLPNVLIEAQLAGVPVVSSPAGGAGEALLDGETGFVTSGLESIDLQELSTAVDHVISWRASGDPRFSEIRKWATKRFSMERMIENTILALTRAEGSPASDVKSLEIRGRSKDDTSGDRAPDAAGKTEVFRTA